MRIMSYSPFGYEGSVVEVEADLRRGIPAVDMVGLADGEVAAARERVKSAIPNSGFELPLERMLISLSPADLKKEGAGFDLPIALAILKEKYSDEMPRAIDDRVLVMGELELSGRVRPVRAATAALQTAFKDGIEWAIVPETDGLSVPKGMLVRQVKDLRGAWEALCNVGEEVDGGEEEEMVEEFKVEFAEAEDEAGFNSIRPDLKLAMAVAVAGRHSMLAYGPPGCGKTLALQHLPDIMPKLTKEERQSVERIYSIAGLEGIDASTRPFRQPHQTASIEGMCGGGQSLRPGEVTLAHNGVLFLDEAAEFRSSVLQMLRVPLETHSITLSRAGRSAVFPANFQLAMATNPCPCGQLGNPDKVCLCSERSVHIYWRKFSAPLIDRVAIRFDCNSAIAFDDLSLLEVRQMIRLAWESQRERQGKLNGDLSLEESARFVKLTDSERDAIADFADKEGLSARGVEQVKRLARTVADLDGRADISDGDVALAIELFGKLPDIVTL